MLLASLFLRETPTYSPPMSAEAHYARLHGGTGCCFAHTRRLRRQGLAVPSEGPSKWPSKRRWPGT